MQHKVNENPLANIIKDGGYTAIFRTIGFIGDNFSSGAHESLDQDGKRGYHDYYEYSWGQFIARTCGLTAYNFSRGGLTAKSFLEYASSVKCFIPKKACQAYVIALGANDINHMNNAETYPGGFGSIKDVDFYGYNNNKPTFVGYYVKIIQKIRELQPKTRIFVVTPPTEVPENENKQLYYDKIAEFLRALPSYFEFLYLIDLRKYAPLYDIEFKKKYFCGWHMSAMGYKFTADMISTYIDYIIRNNYEDFKQVAFIGTNFTFEKANE